MKNQEEKNIRNAEASIKKLQIEIIEVTFPLSFRKKWGGAGVVVSKERPKKRGGKFSNFYPSPKYVISPFYREISWLFYELRDVFYENKLIDYGNKEEFFGRLANAANWYIKGSKEQHVDDVLNIMLIEAKIILREIKNNDFMFLPAGFGGIILDDLKDKIRRKKS